MRSHTRADLEGLDEIRLTLRECDAIAAYEGRRREWLPTAQ